MKAGEFEVLPDELLDCRGAIAMVLGSGLGEAVEKIEIKFEVPFGKIPGLPVCAVPGHAGRLIKGKIAGVTVLAAQGRVHLYEGWTALESTAIVRMLHAAGCRTLLLTNAAGSLCSDFQVGRWMLIRDQINLTGTSPLLGGPNFVDMTGLYSPKLANLFVNEACRLGIPLHEGVYAGLLGPQYETAAEIRMLRTLGADAVGMSTVLEAIQARALGMEVCGLSCLTNWGAGIMPAALSHDEVLETGKKSTETFGRLLSSVLPNIDMNARI